MRLEILVAILATDFQDLVAKKKNLVALVPVLGAILRPVKVKWFRGSMVFIEQIKKPNSLHCNKK